MSDERTKEQKMQAVKVLLMQQLNQIYGQYTRFIKELPIDGLLKQFAIMNADQGLMWVEQGLKKLQFEVEEKQNAIEAGKQQEGNSGEHQAGDQGGKAAEAGGGDCPVECPKAPENETEEVETDRMILRN